MTGVFNKDLCEERHEDIRKWREGVDKKQKQSSNRSIAFLSLLSANLVIGIVILLIALASKL